MSYSIVDPWFVYIIQSESTGRLYTGMTNSPTRRLREHNTSSKGAKYTKSGRPWKMVYLETVDSRSSALKRELRIKKLSKQQKLSLISGKV